MTERQKDLGFEGLTSEQARTLQEEYGKNELNDQKKESFWRKAFGIICEPMFLLLIAAAVIYFILGEPRDGAIMLVFVLGVIGIEIVQEWKTDNTLNALKDLSAPQITVIRDGDEKQINSVDLVPGDVMMISEGVKVPADGEILRLSDLCVDESSLTGESEGVWKSVSDDTEDYWKKNRCYAGTLVTQGSAFVKVDKIGSQTEYGKISKNVAQAPQNPTPLQSQTSKLVKICAGIAALFFALVAILTFLNLGDYAIKDRVISSILSGITLAMAMIPEEFPVVLTVFLSMGAWRLAKKNSLVRRLPSVETLGAVSVLCVDKTGTITKNEMTVTEVWSVDGDEDHLTEIMGLGCEAEAYDPMEKAMLRFCEERGISREHLLSGELLSEYPFTNESKMMGHVWQHDEQLIVAAKGSPERILTLCDLDDTGLKAVKNKIDEMSRMGLRVIAVGCMYMDEESEVPHTLEECRLVLCGIVGLSDPPKDSVKDDIRRCTEAGVRVVMITGDNGITASSIAEKIGMPNSQKVITGEELNAMEDDELKERVKNVNIFSRVIPEHKMRIVNAFKANGDIVAMTGDGVNDAPALKHADIGIAMGKRGSEVSREAADLILMDDNFSTIVDTIRDGRRIYDNIRKAIGYVFSIHIPIAFASLMAPFLNISPESLLLLPLHVVLLELIIDPTCSIVLERQPAEQDIMKRPPRPVSQNIMSFPVLVKSILQGLAIFAASFGTYYAFLYVFPENAALARTMGLVIIMLSNVFLVQVNSSDVDFAAQSMVRLARDRVMWMACALTVAGVLAIVYTPISGFLKLAPLSPVQLLLAACISGISVLWYEVVKLVKVVLRMKKSHLNDDTKN